MKNLYSVALLSVFVTVLAVTTLVGQDRGGQAPAAGRGAQAPAPPPAAQPGHGMGKLVIFADVAVFIHPADPRNCFLTNRFKRGERMGWRMTAVDGNTGEVENTAELTVHVTSGGKTVDVPARWRGGPFQDPTAAAPRGYLRPPKNLWVSIWVIPQDQAVGAVRYTVTAKDRFGRTAEFIPFLYENSQIAIVE